MDLVAKGRGGKEKDGNSRTDSPVKRRQMQCFGELRCVLAWDALEMNVNRLIR